MLKFNFKNHKIKELEQYGFKYNPAYDIYELIGNERFSGDLKTREYITAWKQDGEVEMQLEIESRTYHETTRDLKLIDVLFDLIRNGLIYKEEK